MLRGVIVLVSLDANCTFLERNKLKTRILFDCLSNV